MNTQFQIAEKGFNACKSLEDNRREIREFTGKELPQSLTGAILMTLLGVAKHHNKPYCFVSQNRQLELLSKYHSWNISRSTLNRRLKELEIEGYIIRIRRHRKAEDGRILFNSTLYKFTAKLFHWLGRLGRAIAKIFSFYRVPQWLQHKSLRENKIYKDDPAYVEILWKSNGRWFLKGRASPSKALNMPTPSVL